jgi:hypothetical protein
MTFKRHLKWYVFSVAGSVLLASVYAIGQTADWSDSKADHEGNKDRTKRSIFIVLYEGPLVHDQNWTLTAAPPGPDNQKPGGTCSMIPHDVHNAAGSGFERVTFEAERNDLGFWEMAWTETLVGVTSDGNNYAYRQHNTYTGPTTDGHTPRPNRGSPSGDDLGFLQVVPSNVNADSVDMVDQFALYPSGGALIASSHLHFIWRLRIPPVENDLPPDFFPALLDNKYIVNTHIQLAGEFGCDPL